MNAPPLISHNLGKQEDVHDAIEGIMEGRYILSKDGSILLNLEFDKDAEKGYTTNMSAKVDTTLIPYADHYFDNGFNLLLIGLHGTGKTETVKALAEAKGIKMKYFSCATLDPYTDLVGIPTPRDFCPSCKLFFKDVAKCDECGTRTVESLKMVRPRDVDDAELIFFDELNRSETKVQNAVLEIIQFRSINGDPLPNLKACWAATNPQESEQNYEVERLDPALLDRFDLYIEIAPKPSVVYMSKHMPEPIARALKTWWDDHMNAIRLGSKDENKDYISPRRLEKLGLIWCATHNSNSVFNSLPRGGTFEKRKLMDYLNSAQKEIEANDPTLNKELFLEDDFDDENMSGAGLGDRPWSGIVYRPATLKLEAKKMAAYLTENPGHEATHNRVISVLKTGRGGEELVISYGKIINALNPAKLEGMMADFPTSKITLMREGFMRMYNDPSTLDEAKSYTQLWGLLDKAKGVKPDGWPTSL